ncbi:hypothetical protein BDN72DRAFT_873265, partial [Pluteus cervinus]
MLRPFTFICVKAQVIGIWMAINLCAISFTAQLAIGNFWESKMSILPLTLPALLREVLLQSNREPLQLRPDYSSHSVDELRNSATSVLKTEGGLRVAVHGDLKITMTLTPAGCDTCFVHKGSKHPNRSQQRMAFVVFIWR